MYTVQSGDTLTGIAMKLWGSYAPAANLIQWNFDTIENPDASRMNDGRYNVIRPGMNLRTEAPSPVQPSTPISPEPPAMFPDPVPVTHPPAASGGFPWGWILLGIVALAVVRGGGKRYGKKK